MEMCHITHVMVAPLESVGVPLKSTNHILPGAHMVYGAKYHTELSITQGGGTSRVRGSPLESTTRPLYYYINER